MLAGTHLEIRNGKSYLTGDPDSVAPGPVLNRGLRQGERRDTDDQPGMSVQSRG